MQESQKDGDLTLLLSSYGLMTAERILERYSIDLSQQEISAVVKNPHCLYHKMLRLPFKQVKNSIIIQQAQDYYVYAQKIFVDYLLSGETAKSEDLPGGSTRELLEEERQRLLTLGNEFHQLKSEANKLIAESQTCLIRYASSLKITSTQTVKSILEILHTTGIPIITIDKALLHALVYTDLSDKTRFGKLFIDSLGLPLDNNQKMATTGYLENLLKIIYSLDDQLSDFIVRSEDLGNQITHFRSEFYQLILRCKELISLLPEYKHDAEQENRNKETLDFDPGIV